MVTMKKTLVIILYSDAIADYRKFKENNTNGLVTFVSSLENKINLDTSLKSPSDVDEAVNLLAKTIHETVWANPTTPP